MTPTRVPFASELVGAFWESNGFGRNIAGSLAKTFVVKENGQVICRDTPSCSFFHGLISERTCVAILAGLLPLRAHVAAQSHFC